MLVPLLAMALTGIPGADGHDVIVYGGTPGGIACAIQARRMGKTAILVEPTAHVGGMTTSGLGATDSGEKRVIGGIAREFYRRLRQHYENPRAWNLESRDKSPAWRTGPSEDAQWTFEPKVAEKVLEDWLKEAGVDLSKGDALSEGGDAVGMEGRRIRSIRLVSGKVILGQQFVDASYEGDLLARAGVPHRVGRESNRQHNETLNGVQRARNTHNHRFLKPVNGYRIAGDPSSGLLAGIEAELPAEGEGDSRLQAYCFRMCMTRNPDNLTPWAKPANYREGDYELLFRNFEAGDLRIPMHPLPMPNGKTDTNNNGAFSTDFIGGNRGYAQAGYAGRAAIVQRHLEYQQGLMWSLTNHPRVPQAVRDHCAQWGLARDEFVGHGNWPWQIYVREGRRLEAELIQTERHCLGLDPVPDPVGMGSYNMDSHNCARYVDARGNVQNEGDVQESPGGPYPVSYRAMVPKAGTVDNLLVPVCIGSTHIAFGSIRMEPVFFVLGQSAGTAAALAIDGNLKVADVPYARLRERLLRDGQVLEFERRPRRPGAARGVIAPIEIANLPGIVRDDEQALAEGNWATSSSVPGYIGSGYRHDGNTGKGKGRLIFEAEIPKGGRYEVRLAYSPNANRSRRVPVTVEYGGKTVTVPVDQTRVPAMGKPFVSLGTWDFPAGVSRVIVANEGTEGHVTADAVQWLAVP